MGTITTESTDKMVQIVATLVASGLTFEVLEDWEDAAA